MTAVDLKFGIPNIELAKTGGGTVNPSAFAGHQLVVVFCPSKPSAAAQELSDYGAHASELCSNDAWIIAVCDEEAASSTAARHSGFSVATDRHRTGWSAFQNLSKNLARQDPEWGAVFLFGRGGALQRVWAGSGHAHEVMRELNQRA